MDGLTICLYAVLISQLTNLYSPSLYYPLPQSLTHPKCSWILTHTHTHACARTHARMHARTHARTHTQKGKKERNTQKQQQQNSERKNAALELPIFLGKISDLIKLTHFPQTSPRWNNQPSLWSAVVQST